jgi:hypothetical protein
MKALVRLAAAVGSRMVGAIFSALLVETTSVATNVATPPYTI